MEEGWEGVKVEEISRENIKPSISTPTHLKEQKLCLFDQTASPIPTATLLFYPSHQTTRQKLDIAHLKTTLSQTLNSFYPLAGRYITWDTIDCNDQGVPFIVTHVNCPLSSVLNFCNSGSRKLELLSKLYPPTEFAIIGSGIQVAIQINVFSCGGFVVGWYHSHKPFDGISAATFLRHWAALASNRNPELPDFVAAVTAFPQYPAEKDLQLRPRMAHLNQRSDATNKSLLAETLLSSDADCVFRSFVFKRTAVADLKARAATKAVTSPSRLLAVSAFIWKHLLPPDQQRRSGLGITVNVRPRANPPLSNTCIGNLSEMVVVDLADHDSNEPTQLPQLVSEIHTSISKVKYMIRDYNGDRRGESKIDNFSELINTLIKYMDDFYVLVVWCKSSGFADVDFGFGNPKWIIPTHERLLSFEFQKNTILLVDYLDSEDDIEFEAWLFLDEKKMTMLESNEEFLHFCSPRF